MYQSFESKIKGELTELAYNQEFEKHKRYHHTDKGCDIELFTRVREDPSGKSIAMSKKCLTHNVECSKTGWELGWYMGTYSKMLTSDTTFVSKCRCGRKFINNKYRTKCLCPKCIYDKRDKKNTT